MNDKRLKLGLDRCSNCFFFGTDHSIDNGIYSESVERKTVRQKYETFNRIWFSRSVPSNQNHITHTDCKLKPMKFIGNIVIPMSWLTDCSVNVWRDFEWMSRCCCCWCCCVCTMVLINLQNTPINNILTV